MVFKVQLFGHSFIRRFKNFIRDTEDLCFSLNLDQRDFFIQYSGFPGARVRHLRGHLDVVSDFKPDLVFLVIGTNDLYDREARHTATEIVDLVDTLKFVLKVPEVVVCQTLYRRVPSKPSRYPVDVDIFGKKVDDLNDILESRLKSFGSVLWRLKGFWSEKSMLMVFDPDGVHLSVEGNRRLFKNIRALVVSYHRRRSNSLKN